ncbi:MAG: hypothetical protein GXP17_08825 [Gammaproteobacteria bacterium]|nr:hypothetical protein [Gammaproteobacteria bacterium]
MSQTRAKKINWSTSLLQGVVLAAAVFSMALVQASDKGERYVVTITNLTHGQTFTPIMVASHKHRAKLFDLGEPASMELAIAAESGNTQPLSQKLVNAGMAYDVVSTGGLLGPGESVSVIVKAKKHFRHISVMSMLIPTNDAFVAANAVPVPKKRHMQTIMSPVYDAGSELNDELCANIPGPYCGGAAVSPEDGEGYVHIHPGIHGVGDLIQSQFDWRNPAAKITIKRIK